MKQKPKQSAKQRISELVLKFQCDNLSAFAFEQGMLILLDEERSEARTQERERIEQIVEKLYYGNISITEAIEEIRKKEK